MPIQNSILERISTLKNLPTLPNILLKLIDACNNEETSVSDVSKLVEKDPSLSGKVLRLINSVYYGLPRKVKGIDQGVALLGTDAVKNIAICASVHQAFKLPDNNSFFNLKTFWWHSLKCAVTARLIAKKTGYESPDEAFMTGLLHDIGKLVLYINFPKEYEIILKKYKNHPDQLVDGEVELGITHYQIGAWLIKNWKLQTPVSDAVLRHHEPLEKIVTAPPLVQIVYAADSLTKKPDIEDSSKIGEKLYGFTLTQTKELLSKADEELEEAAFSLDIEVKPPEELEISVSEKDNKKQQELVGKIHDASLMLGTLQNIIKTHDEDGILKTVHEGIQILFDVENILFFLHDTEKNGLIGKVVSHETQSSMINDLIIPMKSDGSIIIKSLVQGNLLESFSRITEPDFVIIDKQIIQVAGKEGMLCIPMLASGEHIGVIVLGLDKIAFSHISKHLDFLKIFADQTAMALFAEKFRQNQLKKIQAERLDASLNMTKRVIHEVNNPLSIMKNYLKILEIKLAGQKVAQDEIRILNEEISRVARILNSLASFSKNNFRNFGSVNINALLSDLVKITKESLLKFSKIDIHISLDPAIPVITTEKDALKQVFINLIKNASEAMPDGGNIYIKTRYFPTSIKNDCEREKNERCGHVEITINDDGPGVCDEIKSKLFEPFVSSKGKDHSGIGLSIVHNIVKTLNGTIACESKKGRGAGFIIGLPVSDNCGDTAKG